MKGAIIAKKHRVALTETILRDAHQSLAATRMRTRDMLPAIDKLDNIGYFSLEVWGGATFDSMIRYLNEDPWERISTLKKKLKKTPTQMLLRGQNLVAYRNYPDDVVEAFVRLAAKNGVDIFRIFDALNDIRNMELSIRIAKECGKHVQGCLSYTTSPVHTIENYVKLAKDLEEHECDSVCVKDMAGLITPKAAYDLIKALKKEIKIPINLHTHCTSGMGPISYYAGCEAGVDILDTAISPWGWGTSQPPTEPMVASLIDGPYSTGYNLEELVDLGFYFLEMKKKYDGLISPLALNPDVSVLLHQVPGGMLSNLHSQLKEQNALDRYRDVLDELPQVRKELGYPPLVTPSSQVVGMQAVLNVLTGKRYEKVTQEVKDYCMGFYGKTPAPIDPKILKKVIGKEQPISVRPADLLAPQLEKLEAEAEEMGILNREEDLITYALYPNVAPQFLKGELKEEPMPKVIDGGATAVPAGIPNRFIVDVDGDEFQVKVTPVGVEVEEGDQSGLPKEMPEGTVVAPLQGLLLEIKVKQGDIVKKGDTVIILEAMKMQTEVHADHDGEVKEIYVAKGDTVNIGDGLLVIQQNQE